MRNLIFILILFSTPALAEIKKCAIDEYKRYLNIKIEATKENSLKFSKLYPSDYSIIEKVLPHLIHWDEFEIYTADVVLNTHPQIINTSGSVEEVLPEIVEIQNKLSDNKEYVSKTNEMLKEKKETEKYPKINFMQYMQSSMLWGDFLKENNAYKVAEDLQRSKVADLCKNI